MARKFSAVFTGTVSIETGGKTYTGSYTIKDGWITVSGAHWSRHAEILRGPPGRPPPQEGFARMLLGEIIQKAARNGHLRA
jgi:hypothetical protein